MRNVSVSVAMATYNGEKYIEEQLVSVLKNLDPQDEVIISDDGSTDKTLEIIKGLNDPRIKIIEGPGLGSKENFENAILHCGGRYIFLCDQDDIWADNKVDTVVKTFLETQAPVVVHDCEIVDDAGTVLEKSYFEYRKSGPGAFKNFMKNTYIGCCMAFNAALIDAALPIPESVYMHDQWIGIIGDRLGENVFIKDSLIKYRRHGDTVTDCFNHGGIMSMLSKRFHLFIEMIKR